MYLPRETVTDRIGRMFRTYTEDIAHEQLPKRWVELILELDEQERRRSESTTTASAGQSQENK
jgi:hypothetical protein